MVKHDVEIETVGEGVDEIDKLAELTDEMQLKQKDQGCVHASNELQLHVVHVVANVQEECLRTWCLLETAPMASCKCSL
ncbi:hypothetical protein Tco_0292620, partial [Tanacetum coccineum]